VPLQQVETLTLENEMDMVRARQAVRARAVQLGFRLVDQTKIVTAASELARNTLIYGKGGTMQVAAVTEGLRKGIHLVFEDHGPGIPDVALALRDGYTTGTGLGLGLGGAKRLVNDLAIDSRVGEGTRITVTKWI
jgi:serine/threonine-protein kinase RsbT